MDVDLERSAMAEQQGSITQAVKQYGRALYAFILGRVRTDADAEDVLQDVWTQLASQPELDAIEQVSGWLYTNSRYRSIRSTCSFSAILLRRKGPVAPATRPFLRIVLRNNNCASSV